MDILIVGAGAAGLMAAAFAGRSNPEARILLVDGARTIGAKILVAGGGRCNVTHYAVDESAYAGSTRPAIRNVLRRFDVPETVAFFRELGVHLKREDTGKLFPTTDRARDVLNALLRATREAGVELRHPWRAETVAARGDGFVATSREGETIEASRAILATGGLSLPKSGSDGHGHVIVRGLGHTITPRVFPALVPLKLAEGCFVRSLSGLTVDAALTVRDGRGKALATFENSTLCTHFGLSGPSVLDISRYWTDAHLDDPAATLSINWLPGEDESSVDAALRELGKETPLGWLKGRLAARLATAIVEAAGLDARQPAGQLKKDDRRRLVRTIVQFELPVTGDRGYTFAEVTAGGVPLKELDLKTMQSRVRPGLYLCGEICDVDGRIGGFNFQWAWASGFVAGSAAAM